jgi:hypothetical protein
MTDKLTLGQDYFFKEDWKDLWTLYSVAEDMGRNGDGITEVQYHFGRMFKEGTKEAHFGQVSLPGSVIRLCGKNRVNTSDGFFGCGFTYNIWAIKEGDRMIQEAKQKPKNVEVVRRAISLLDSIDDFKLLLDNFDILPLCPNYRRIPGLFRGLRNGNASIAYRTSDGLLKSIHQGDYPIQQIRFGNGFLHGRALELPSSCSSEEFEYDLREKPAPSIKFVELDALLKSRGI